MRHNLCDCCTTPRVWFASHIDAEGEYLKMPVYSRGALLAEYHDTWGQQEMIDAANDPEYTSPTDDDIWNAYTDYMEIYGGN